MKHLIDYFGEEAAIVEKIDVDPVIRMTSEGVFVTIGGVNIMVEAWPGNLENDATVDMPAELLNNGKIRLDDASIEALVERVNACGVAEHIDRKDLDFFNYKVEGYIACYISWNMREAEPMLKQIMIDNDWWTNDPADIRN